MFCPNCGSKNDDGIKFCANCGNLIENNQAVTNDDNNYPFIVNDNFKRLKSQIDSIKDQPDTALSDKDINELAYIINDDNENIIYFISGSAIFGDDFLLMVLTSKRVIIAKWGFLTHIKEIKSILLENIKKISSSIGIMGAEITIEYGNNSEYIKDVGKESGKLFEYKINKELEKFKNQNEIQIEETEEVKENNNLYNNSNIHSNKDKYLFLKNTYINCNSIQEIKKEENSILIMTSKNSYCLKYNEESKAIYHYNKLISFIADEIFEIEEDYKE